MKAFKVHTVAVATCDCCGSEVTELCGECVGSICEPCHAHKVTTKHLDEYLLDHETCSEDH